jgi:hypothetical protein
MSSDAKKSSSKPLIIIDIFDKVYQYKPRLEKSLNNKIIKEEHLIDCNNNASIIEESIINYKITPNSCFLQHLYNNIKNFYSEENNKPILEPYVKSLYQQKYNIQLYLIFDILELNNDKDNLVNELCNKSGKRVIDTIIEGYQIEKYSETLCFVVSSFLKEIHDYLYSLFNKPYKMSDFYIEKYIIIDNSLTTEIEVNGYIAPIFELGIYDQSSNKQKTIKNRNNKEYLDFDKKEILERNSVNSELLSASTNSWSNYVLQNKILSKISKSLNSTIGTDLSKYTSFDAMLESYRYYIKKIGDSRKIDVFVNLCTFLNYAPPIKDVDRLTKEMVDLTQKIKEPLNLLTHISMLKENTLELSYKNLSKILEKGISFYIKTDTESVNNCMPNSGNAANAATKRIVLFLSNKFFNEIANSSDTITTIERGKLLEDYKKYEHNSETDIIESFCLFLKQSKNIKSYSNFNEYEKALKDGNSYFNIEKADCNLIFYGNYRFKTILEGLKHIITVHKTLSFDGVPYKVDGIFIQTRSYYSIPNNVCDKAFKIREKSMNCPDWENEEKDLDIRGKINYCGTVEYSSNELFTKENDILSKYTDCNPFAVFIASRTAHIQEENRFIFDKIHGLATIVNTILLDCSYKVLKEFNENGNTDYLDNIEIFNKIALYNDYVQSKLPEDNVKLDKLIKENPSIQWLTEYLQFRKSRNFNKMLEYNESSNKLNVLEKAQLLKETEFQANRYYRFFINLQTIQEDMEFSIEKNLNKIQFSKSYNGLPALIVLLYTKRAIQQTFSSISIIFDSINGNKVMSLLKKNSKGVLGTALNFLSLRNGEEKSYLINSVNTLLSALNKFKAILSTNEQKNLDIIVGNILEEKMSMFSIDNMDGRVINTHYTEQILNQVIQNILNMAIESGPKNSVIGNNSLLISNNTKRDYFYDCLIDMVLKQLNRFSGDATIQSNINTVLLEKDLSIRFINLYEILSSNFLKDYDSSPLVSVSNVNRDNSAGIARNTVNRSVNSVNSVSIMSLLGM